MNGIIHPILTGVSFKRLHLLPVSQRSLLNALILPDELLLALPALRFRLMMLLGFVLSVNLLVLMMRESVLFSISSCMGSLRHEKVQRAAQGGTSNRRRNNF